MTCYKLNQKHSKFVCLISLLSLTIFSNPIEKRTYSPEVLDTQITNSDSLISQAVPADLGLPKTGRRRAGTNRFKV
ncbi:MAG: hypothetical protein AAF915_15990 [Cyanobacteria bacterium P01_D01_bin.50]